MAEHPPNEEWPEDEGPDGDAFSDYDPTIASTEFGSVTSSVNNHFYEYGRRYSAFRPDTYPLPNDGTEGERENLRHVMFYTLMRNRLFLAPIGNNPQKILDVGTGFGDWAIEMADEFPGARVIGVDLSPVQPLWVPPNVDFKVDNIEEHEWARDYQDCDLIHLRVWTFTSKDPRGVSTSAFRALKPGGWIEFQEFEPRIEAAEGPMPPNVELFYSTMNGIFSQLYGYKIEFADNLEAELRDLGFVDVHKETFRIPIGNWPTDQVDNYLGRLFMENVKELFAAVAAKPFADGGLDPSESRELLAKAMAELRSRRYRTCCKFNVVYGRRPLT